jgi:hypothetical protein
MLLELYRDFGDIEEYKFISHDSCPCATSVLLSNCCSTCVCNIGTHKNLNNNLIYVGIFKAKKLA